MWHKSSSSFMHELELILHGSLLPWVECWRSLMTISRRQLDQKIMRVCMSYMHLYPNKSLNHTLPSRIYKMCFWANMQVENTLWPDRKWQKISKRRFRLNLTKCSPRTEANQLKTSSTPVFKLEEAQTRPVEEDWGRLVPLGGRLLAFLIPQ